MENFEDRSFYYARNENLSNLNYEKTAIFKRDSQKKSNQTLL